MKIIIVDSLFSPFGGGQKIAYDTYRILQENGHHVYYWGMDKKPYFEPHYKYSEYFTPYYSGVKDYLKNPIKYFYNYKAKNNLQDFVNYINPNIIHFHSFWGISSAVFSVKTSARRILTLHDARCCPATTLMRKDNEFCKELCCKNGNFLPCIMNKCYKYNLEGSIRRVVAAYADKINFKHIDQFITPSDALREIFIQSNISNNAKKIVTINNFLSKEEINITPNYFNKGYFLYVGRLDKVKGVNYLLQAMNDLPKEIMLHIVGTGNEEEYLRKYVKENNLNNVTFLGFKNRKEIKEEYQNCIATILPSNWFENFPTTNMESFINGKPVIASKIGGIPEQVENNKTGLLFEPTNTEELKKCILHYYNTMDLVRQHGENAYKKAFLLYTEERYYLQLMKIYNTIN